MNALDNEQQLTAIARIRTWLNMPTEPADCPVCEATGLRIIDRSTPPHAEWYVISCLSCGLDATLQIPRGTSLIGID